MKFIIIKTDNGVAVKMTTDLTPGVLDLVSKEQKELKDGNNKVVFKVDKGDFSVSEYGVNVPGKSALKVVSKEEAEDIEKLKMKLAKAQVYGSEVEAKVLAEYNRMKESAKTIKVE